MNLCKKSGGDDNNGQLITAKQNPRRGSVPACQSWCTCIVYLAQVDTMLSKHSRRDVEANNGASPLRCRLKGANMSYTGYIQKPI